MKKRMYVLGVAALLAALLALSGVAQSAMWVGAELGGNFQPDTHMTTGSSSGSAVIRPSVIGGATIGYDFVNAGFGAYAWPDWMKYFSFAMDLTYNKLFIGGDKDSGFGRVLSEGSRVNGYEVAWTFLFMAHYGFLPDSEVPGGRINPYIGVGPAIVWTGIEGTLPYQFKNQTPVVIQPAERIKSSNFGGSAMNVALVVEPGIRWVCFKNVSVDTAFRWRYSVPSWGTDGVTIKANPLSQFAFLLRANYHF
jgi:hypothetical protein